MYKLFLHSPPVETTVLAIIDGKKKAPVLKPLLRACSFLFGSALAVRHAAYHLGICKSQQVPAFVISVGNIACGGTGKTPFVRFLAQALAASSKVAILSRGYRSLSECARHPLLITGENGPLFSADVCGDEPYLLASSLPGVSVWVGKRRLEAARLASSQGSEVIILDDGMQYRKLKRDLEIVLVDGGDILAGGRLLPSGRLREFPSRLKPADLIVVNHADEKIPLSAYQEQLHRFTTAPLITVRTHSVIKGVSIAGQRVGLFCALGRPDRFIASIKETAAELVATLLGSDHSSFSEETLQIFAEECRKKGAKALVCSAKDAVKLPPQLTLNLPLAIADSKIELLDGQEAWQALQRRIQQRTLL